MTIKIFNKLDNSLLAECRISRFENVEGAITNILNNLGVLKKDVRVEKRGY